MEEFEKAFPDLKIIRINSGVARGFGHSIIHLAPKGTPDLYIPKPQLHVEMKKPGEELTTEQRAWQAWAKENDVPHVVCDAPSDLIATVRAMIDPCKKTELTADFLRGLIAIGLKFKPCVDEYEYQDQLDAWLEERGFAFLREFNLSAGDRVDFMVEDIAVELKLKCPSNEILRQLARYSQHESVREILILSATRAPLQKIPSTLNGKPVRGLHIGSSI
jgi:hypothetical protein